MWGRGFVFVGLRGASFGPIFVFAGTKLHFLATFLAAWSTPQVPKTLNESTGDHLRSDSKLGLGYY